MTLSHGNQDDFLISLIKGLGRFHLGVSLQCPHPTPLFLEDLRREFKEHIVCFSTEGMAELSQRLQETAGAEKMPLYSVLRDRNVSAVLKTDTPGLIRMLWTLCIV